MRRARACTLGRRALVPLCAVAAQSGLLCVLTPKRSCVPANAADTAAAVLGTPTTPSTASKLHSRAAMTATAALLNNQSAAETVHHPPAASVPLTKPLRVAAGLEHMGSDKCCHTTTTTGAAHALPLLRMHQPASPASILPLPCFCCWVEWVCWNEQHSVHTLSQTLQARLCC